MKLHIHKRLYPFDIRVFLISWVHLWAMLFSRVLIQICEYFRTNIREVKLLWRILVRIRMWRKNNEILLYFSMQALCCNFLVNLSLKNCFWHTFWDSNYSLYCFLCLFIFVFVVKLNLSIIAQLTCWLWLKDEERKENHCELRSRNSVC